MPPADIAYFMSNLYRENQPWLRGWLYTRVGCSEAAADLARDTFLRLLKAGNLPPSGHSVQPDPHGYGSAAQNCFHCRRAVTDALQVDLLLDNAFAEDIFSPGSFDGVVREEGRSYRVRLNYTF